MSHVDVLGMELARLLALREVAFLEKNKNRMRFLNTRIGQVRSKLYLAMDRAGWPPSIPEQKPLFIDDLLTSDENN